MNQLIAMNTELTMTSREIAELTGKRHDNVLADIRKMLAEIQSPEKSGDYKDARGRAQPCLLLNKDESYCLMAGYSAEFRMKIIRRWRELEEKNAHPDPMAMLNDPSTMRSLLLSYSEKVISLESKVEEMQTDVEALERIAKAEGSMCITDAAKNLQIQPKSLFKLLLSNLWIYKRAGGKSWIAYQDKIQRGYLEHKVTTVSRSDGSEKVVEQVLVTAKGIAKIAKLIGVSVVVA